MLKHRRSVLIYCLISGGKKTMWKQRFLAVGFAAVFLVLPISAGAACYTTTDYSAHPSADEIYSTALPGGLEHGIDYFWDIGDVLLNSNEKISRVNIIFHNFYNNSIDDPTNTFEVSLYNENRIGMTSLGLWSDTDGPMVRTDDVVFYTEDASLLAYLTLGNTFGIMGDPQCHYYGDRLSVDVLTYTSEVPIPSSVLLLGSGLAGIFGYRRKRRR